MSTELPKMREGLRALIGGLRYCQDAAVEVGKDTIIAEVEAYAKEAARLALEDAAKVCDDEYQRIMALQEPGAYGSTEEAVNTNLRMVAVMLPQCASAIRALAAPGAGKGVE